MGWSRWEQPLAQFNRFLDWFIPPNLIADRERRHCARMFLVSHFFGPVLGNILPLYLWLSGFGFDYRLAVFIGVITVFWAYPFALRAFGRYRLLVVLSVENLIFTIFWACFHYGGASSPFVPWVLTIPLLAFFYVGRATWMIWTLPSLMLLNFLGFAALYQISGGFPTVELSRLHDIGLLSMVSAACYVSMMALYYANIFKLQVELEGEVREHLTNLRRAVAESVRAGAAKTEFVASMSHELRTPLNAVIGYSQLLLEEAGEDMAPTMMGDLRNIRESGHRLLNLVNDVLDFSKIDAGKMSVACERVNVAEVLGDAVADRRTVMEKNGNVVVVSSTDVGEAELDAFLVRRALGHVMENAAKFTRNGTISIDARRCQADGGEDIVFTIRDSGVGIAAEQMRGIFDLFRILDEENATNYGGPGIGLALTRKICLLLGGDISVRSAPGTGSEFTIRLPGRPPAREGDGMRDAFGDKPVQAA